MNDALVRAIEIVETSVRSEFERIWEETTTETPPEYRILVWGSTVQDKDSEPTDLDLMFEYTGDKLQSGKQKSIEGWLQNCVTISKFTKIDPLVIHQSDVPSLISNSRVSRVYSTDDDEWVEF